MRTSVPICALMLVAAARLSVAQPVQFLATDGNRLYRGDLAGNVQPFVTLSADIQSLTRVPEGYGVPGAVAGDIIATAADATSGAWRVFRLDDPFGTPTLTQIGSTSFSIGSLAFSPQGLFGVNGSASPMRVSSLSMVDFSTVQNFSTGINVAGGGGIASAPGSSQFYLTDATNDRLMAWSPGGTAVAVGGVGFAFSNNGLEYLNGQLYGALRRDSQPTQMSVGTFNLSTGAFTTATTITGILGNGTGFVTIPSPGAAAVLGLGSLLASRRRR